MNARIETPKLKPGKYSFLRFRTVPGCEWVDVFLPNGDSYTVDFKELKIFLKRSKVERYEKLLDWIWSYGTMIWNRYRQSFWHVPEAKMIPKEDRL